MAQSNWAWIAAVNPVANTHPSRLHLLRREDTGHSRWTRRYGSFWNRKEARQFSPCTDQNGNLLNHVAGKGKTVVMHTKQVKALVWNARRGEMVEVLTG